MTRLAEPLPFPATLPQGYELQSDEPRYDPERHLALEKPAVTLSLEDFGYDPQTRADSPSPLAVTGPFRVLSEEGVAAMREVVQRLRAKATRLDGNRVPLHLAGGVYRSRFLRDFCNCPVLAAFFSELTGTKLVAHSMPSQQLYVNFAPDDIEKAVDAWHFDGVGFDMVLMLSDPANLKGGRFEYFKGTRREAAALLGTDEDKLYEGGIDDLPDEKVERVAFPDAGYGVFQQGNLVVHRAARLLEPGERITVVPSFVSLDVAKPDPTDTPIMPAYGEPGILTELARHAAWRGRTRLDNILEHEEFSEDPLALARQLREAIADVERVATNLEAHAAPKMKAV